MLINARAENIEDLFKKAGEEMLLLTNPELKFGVTGYSFKNLPETLNISGGPKVQEEINQKFAKYKEFRPQYDDSTPAAEGQTINKLEQLGLNPAITKDILDNDEALLNFVRSEVLRSHESIIQKQLSDQFIEEYVAPRYWKRDLTPKK